MNNYQELPTELQDDITVLIRKTTFRGQEQLQARYGKYKVVVNASRFLWPQDGETWIVQPNNSPNGHIVFCRPVRCIGDKHGNDPMLTKLHSYIGQPLHCVLGYGRDLVEKKIEKIEDVIAIGETIVIKGVVKEVNRNYVIFRENGETQISLHIPDLMEKRGSCSVRYILRDHKNHFAFGD